MKVLLTILTLCLGKCIIAQNSVEFRLMRTIPVNASNMAVDNFGNLFVFSPAGQLKKLSPEGDSIAVYNDVKQYGNLYSIDVSNPLKVLLYYKDYGTVVVLDRLLNVRNTIDLRRLNLLQVSAIGQAYDNGIWVFDAWEARIKHIGYDGRVIDQWSDFRQLFDSMPVPEFLIDQNKMLYLYDSTKGVYLFDYYGTFKNRIPLTGWQDFTVINNVIYGRNAGTLYRYIPGSLNLQEYSIPNYLRNALRIKITAGGLYVLRDNRIEIYAYSGQDGSFP